jgi:hypothetical protein
MSAPALRWHSLFLPKRGHSADEYEDALAADPATGRLALADGASESSFAGLWAHLLVESFVHPPAPASAEGTWLEVSRRRWSAAVGGRALPWYAEAKRDQGAFATFLGVILDLPTPVAPGRWRALAVGDSCLFLVRGGCLAASFPLGEAAAFHNQPPLLGSRLLPGEPRAQPHQEKHGQWQTGDRFLMMTDALAQWFLSQHEAGRKPWEELLLLVDAPETFPSWINQHREGGSLRNDDVTLLLVGMELNWRS